ncbi:MAG: low molecular weight protein-tyrosine-phosphatase [Acholeplasmataceae bacterium]|nr:low molecular weight protein-tyrosine-phosphatase [Acholeplasmataceae bacterium]
MIKVVFVCLGNICRSPMAEGLFKKIVMEKGYQDCFHVESRATSSWEQGNPPHPNTVKILVNENISINGMVSQKMETKDFKTFDYIIGMDHDNVRYLKQHANSYKDKVFLLRDVSLKTKGEIIPDPYYTGKYKETYELLMESLPLWVEKMILEKGC